MNSAIIGAVPLPISLAAATALASKAPWSMRWLM
jgi:hypothetical protein